MSADDVDGMEYGYDVFYPAHYPSPSFWGKGAILSRLYDLISPIARQKYVKNRRNSRSVPKKSFLEAHVMML